MYNKAIHDYNTINFTQTSFLTIFRITLFLFKMTGKIVACDLLIYGKLCIYIYLYIYKYMCVCVCVSKTH